MSTSGPCAVIATVFLNGWVGPFPFVPPWIWFFIKSFAVFFIMMWIKFTMPRFRIDQMLGLAWKVLVPASLVNLLWVAVVLKLPMPGWVQWILALGGNVAVLIGALTLLGRSAKHYSAGQAIAARPQPSEGV